MKHASVLLICFLFTACKVADNAAPVSVAPKQTLLQKEGCSVSKNKGNISVNCTDGSAATASAPVLRMKDGNGNNFANNLLYVGTFGAMTPVFLNMTSGNILSYDTSGNISSIDRVYFDGPNCTGNAYAVPPDMVIKNKVLANNHAWPGGAEAFRLTGYSHAAVSIQSQFTTDACTAMVSPAVGLSSIALATFDNSDPRTFALPLELVSE